MRQVWNFGIRWITLLGFTATVLISGGCGGGGGDGGDNLVGNDATPNAFSFTLQMNVTPGSTVTSNSITVAGIDAPATITITGGGSYSINGGAFTSTAGTVNNGQTVAVRHTASGTTSTTTTSTLTIGDVSAPFTTITAPPAGADVTPASFSFAPRTGLGVGTVATSGPITVTGIDAPAPITITGGSYSIDGGTYTSAPGVIRSGQTVTVRQTCSSLANTSTTATLTIGGVYADFITTTAAVAVDTTPDTFSFIPQTGAFLDTVSTSSEVTVTGINAHAAISVTGGTYSINGGPFTSNVSTVTNRQKVRVQHRSAATNNTVTTTTLTIGGVSASFTTTTIANGDTTPDPFGFFPQINVPVNTAVTSATITVTGIDLPTPISITGGTYSINGGPYTSAAGTVSNGQTVTVRHTSSASFDTSVGAILTIGPVSAYFVSTTEDGSGIDVAALYMSRCAACHSLLRVDPQGTAPNLIAARDTELSARFPTPSTAHQGVTLTTVERKALVTYFNNI